MSTRTKASQAARKSHDRAAMVQWVTIGLVIALGLAAILFLTDSGGLSGGHGGFLTVLN